jgi:hypothetical protein
MSLDNKIEKFYKLRLVDLKLGWVLSDSIDFEEPIVISEPSVEKDSDENKNISAVSEGIGAALYSDYLQYFIHITGSEPAEFFEGKNDEEEFSRLSVFSKDHVRFLFALGRFLIDKKDFSIHGRSYRLVVPDGENRDEAK